MSAKTGFRFLEHTADIYIAAYGKNLAEAFENAAVAMFEVMTETAKVNPQIEDYVEVKAEDEYALLYSWLEALLVKSEINEMLYSRFEISELTRTAEGFTLKAKICGEKFNPKKHPQKVGVKAVTYHQMEIIKKPDETTVKFILDI
ncbi:archease [Candidatus Bathyarchaeota archaeon]|nr:archease [Candidatus Bathyarchaeota archaeon]